MSPIRDMLTVRISVQDDTQRCLLVLETGGQPLRAEFPFISPLLPDDVIDATWLLEDYPRLAGATADGIATRIDARLRELKDQLRSAVFESSPETAPIRAALTDMALVKKLRVVITEAADADWLPWELLPGPGSDRPLSIQAASFTRSVFGLTVTPHATVDQRLLRILLVVARPEGKDDVPFRSVASRIVRAASIPGSPLEVTLLRPATFTAIERALAAARIAGSPYNVVHFDGHGAYRENTFNRGRKGGYLRFETDEGYAEEVSGRAMGQLLAIHGVDLLLLNACRSGFTGKQQRNAASPLADPVLGSLATDVLGAGVPNVLAMGFNVYVATAARLVADIYSALGAGGALGEAVAYARGREAARGHTRTARRWEWLVPIAYDATPPVPALNRSDIQSPDAAVTAVSDKITDPSAGNGPRSGSEPFIGYDDVFLQLDRVLCSDSIAQLVGLAGAGKSAVAGEFTRWIIATGAAESALVLDLPDFPSYEDFAATVDRHMRARGLRLGRAKKTANAQPCAEVLLVLEDVDRVLHGGSHTCWNDADQRKLAELVSAFIGETGWILLTGRAPIDWPGIRTVVLEGLDTWARYALVTAAGWDPDRTPAARALIEWTHGIPAVIQQLPAIVSLASPTTIDATYELLWHLRMGLTYGNELDGPHPEESLLEAVGLEVFSVRALTDPSLPLALSLFQGFLPIALWREFCKIAGLKGFDLGGDDASDILVKELEAATYPGLTCQMPGQAYLIHPLAPMALFSGLLGTLAALCGSDEMGKQQLLLFHLHAMHVNTISLTARAQAAMPGIQWPYGPRLYQRQNLYQAMEHAVRWHAWEAALPLIRLVRDELRSEYREDEWWALLLRTVTALREFPPDRMILENVHLLITRILAEEAERQDDQTIASRLREDALRLALADETTITRGEAGDADSVSQQKIYVSRRISALLKRGDSLARSNSADCLTFYTTACDLASENGDYFRLADVQLALARAYLNVEDLYDPSKYEEYARRALATAEEFGPARPELIASCKVSIGTAIVEQLKHHKGDPQRVEEARICLTYAAAADAAEPTVRAAAYNSIGLLMEFVGNLDEAADAYLSACKQLESIEDADLLVVAQVNAAQVLHALGRMADAREIARQAMATLELAPRRAVKLQPALSALLASELR